MSAPGQKTATGNPAGQAPGAGLRVRSFLPGRGYVRHYPFAAGVAPTHLLVARRVGAGLPADVAAAVPETESRPR